MPERNIASREYLAHTGTVIQYNRLLYRRIAIHEATIVQVHYGKKILRWAGKEQIVRAGEAVALARWQSFDVLNEPDAQAGYYQAEWITLEQRMIEQFTEQYGQAGAANDVYLLPKNADFSTSFRQAAHAVSDRHVPDMVVQTRLQELLAWLKHYGTGFLPYQRIGPVQKITQIIATDIGREWTAQEIAAQLNVSEATLRRKLAEDQTSFRRLLTDIRMTHALTLLQVTEQPVSQIAYAVGYESPSRFTARFRERFGFAPSAIRKQQEKGG
ncbi:AraC family transcriptional regulator [Neisseria canis]|uniref:AraC family transcriptional regulator n=1 Tax=Neisseria canis TaxID=493 RepID=A0A1X3CYI9_9NEIS|nr:AraC family transcriptional regulator [Neisseria canis]OSI12698.1 hypothetical protein BWD07_04465 [Neisseria canis]VEF02614.1 AraC family transcriptional regulator [Neisseria canis]